MKPIGGFFELEVPEKNISIHPKAYALSTGRACLMVILQHIFPEKVYIPYYTCDATIEPFIKLNIPIEFYSLDKNMYPIMTKNLKYNEYILWTNYFGVLAENTLKIKREFGTKVILDDTHNFFQSGHKGYWSFTSARKYFGVPDGAFLFAPSKIKIDASKFTGVSIRHNLLRAVGRQNEAFLAYREYERSLKCDIWMMSSISELLLNGVDKQMVMESRRKNFKYLHSKLKNFNQFSLQKLINTPFCYPFLPHSNIPREYLHKLGYYIPSYWPDIPTRGHSGFEFEKTLSSKLLPLPIDHRYNPSDLKGLVSCILEFQ